MAVKRDLHFYPATERRTYAVRWLPDNGDYRAVFQISHGMIEFIERYEPFAAFLADKGYMVVGHDHLGQGKLQKDAGGLGLFCGRRKPGEH